jgi:hypothetical protein
MNIRRWTAKVRATLWVIAVVLPAHQAVAAPPPATAQITANGIVIRNGLVERVWTRTPFKTQRLTDLRNGRTWTSNSADFTLNLRRVEIGSNLFGAIAAPTVQTLANGGVRVTVLLHALATEVPAGVRVRRIIEMYPGVAGMRQETWLESEVPLVLTGYVLDQARPSGTGLNATMHSFRAGADWRDPEWTGPAIVIGDAHPGDWRVSKSGPSVAGTAQWLSIGDVNDRHLFYVLERNDYASSQMSFDGALARASVDLRKDIIYIGPFEEEGHVENPGMLAGRSRAVVPGVPLRLEPVFTGVALNRDDEPWQHYKYLAKFRMPPYRREVTFNSNGVDSNRISTGAKDDMDFAQFLTELAVASQIGIETFIFDDGWQARSGDWCPDSVSDDPACAEPRQGTDPKFAPRFPDSSFQAVQAQLAPKGMKLGLWMTPMHFNPNAVAFKDHPEWLCEPVGAALLAVNLADPDGGSNDAGIVQWNPEALGTNGVKLIDYIESRIRRAIDEWGVRYFKYDFTAWIDCGGLYPVDLYSYRESFMAMLDRVIADHPDVTIQMDETNDYRLFPFEALARGPMWYQNGSPTPPESLHANHVLAPYLPLFALGRNALRASDLGKYSADYQMAVALLSHMTFFNDLTSIPAAARPAIKVWTDYYKKRRAELATFAYPLLNEDPLSGDNWAAFQTWDLDTRRGALLVYRQNAPDAQRFIKLRNIPAGNYRLLEAPTETSVQLFTADQLKAGIPITIPSKNSARVFRIQKIS